MKRLEYKIGRILLAAFATLAAIAAVAADDGKAIRIGVLAYRGEDKAEAAWGATFAELRRALPDRRIEVVAGSPAFLTAAVAAQRLDFLITNPGHHLELAIDYSVKAIATEQDMDGTSATDSVGAAIIVPADLGEVQQLADLQGRRIAAVAAEAFGFRTAWAEFVDRGIDPFRDARLLFVGYPVEGVIETIRAGRADAGIVRACLLEKLIAAGEVRPEEFRVINRKSSGTLRCQVSTRLYPGWPFVKIAQTSPELARRVAQTLLAMQPAAGDVVWSEPQDYQRVQDLYRLLKVGPYAPLSRLGLLDFAWEHRWWGAALATAVAWWLIHVARVSHLLRKRTAELQAAHERARLKGEQMEHTVRLSLLGEMASSLAHEINQPLAAILTYARACERRLAAGDDLGGVQSGVERIALQAERAGSIVRRMRGFVRKNPSRQVPVDPGEVIADALVLFEPTAAARGVKVESSVPARLPTVRADRLQIEEVLLNLLQNALEAVGGRDDGAIRLTAEVRDHAVGLAVTDNGSGLAPGAEDKLFEAFFTTKAEGLGLGLSLSRTIVEAHGGRLDVDVATPGQTTFRFLLPLIEEEARV